MNAAPRKPSLIRNRTSLEPGMVTAILTQDDSDNVSRLTPAAHLGLSLPRKESSASWGPPKPTLVPSSQSSDYDATVVKARAGPDQVPRSTTDTTQPSALPATETNFLATLARQERLVLELREQLHKAEEDLRNLKKQWALQEVDNRRSEIRRVQQLKPLSASIKKHSSNNGVKDDADGSSAWMYEEMERRKALMGFAKTSQRRVFSGSRHTKTLSLLVSGERGLPKVGVEPVLEGRPSSPNDVEDLPTLSPRDDVPPQVLAVTRPDLRPSPALVARRPSHSPQRAVITSGKQIATDIKEGFWTFFEDLRQATVGEEASAAADHERRPSRRDGLLSASRRQSPTRGRPKMQVHAPAIGASLGAAEQSDAPRAATREKLNRPPPSQTPTLQKPLFDDFNDGWDTWPSPPRPSLTRSNSTVSQSCDRISPITASSSRTSTSSTAEATPRMSAVDPRSRDAIPWPALDKLHPGHLRRTASHLMEQWEKSLSPDRAAEDATPARSTQGTPSPMEQQALL